MSRTPYPLSVPSRVPLGVDEHGRQRLWAPAEGAAKTLLVLGSDRSGRTNVLRLAVRHFLLNFLYYGVDGAFDVERIVGVTGPPSKFLTSGAARNGHADTASRVRGIIDDLENIADTVDAGRQYARQPFPNLPRSMCGDGATVEHAVLVDRVDLLFSPAVHKSEQRRAAAVLATLIEMSSTEGLRLALTADDAFIDDVQRHSRTGLPELLTQVDVVRAANSSGGAWWATLNGEPFTVYCDPETPVDIPAFASYPHDGSTQRPWNRIRVGIAEGGVEQTWDVRRAAHMWIEGRVGYGKSMLTQVIATEMAAAGWDMYVVDHPQEWKLLRTCGFAVEPGEVAELVGRVTRVMDARLDAMRESGATSFSVLPDDVRPAALFVDMSLFQAAASKRDVDFWDRTIGEVADNIRRIAKYGRQAGVHLVVSTHPDAEISQVSSPALWKQMGCRVAVGRMSVKESERILGEGTAGTFRSVGRAAMWQIGAVDEFQVYMLPDDC